MFFPAAVIGAALVTLFFRIFVAPQYAGEYFGMFTTVLVGTGLSTYMFVCGGAAVAPRYARKAVVIFLGALPAIFIITVIVRFRFLHVDMPGWEVVATLMGTLLGDIFGVITWGGKKTVVAGD